MEAKHISPLTSSMAGLASVVRERAAVARTRRPPRGVPAVAKIDALPVVGDRHTDPARDFPTKVPSATDFDA